MNDNCTCTPGSKENGWHEVRCQTCREAELEQWRQMLDHLDQWKRTL